MESQYLTKFSCLYVIVLYNPKMNPNSTPLLFGLDRIIFKFLWKNVHHREEILKRVSERGADLREIKMYSK